MKHTLLRTAAIAGLAFAAGFAAARAPATVSAMPARAMAPVPLPSAYFPDITMLPMKSAAPCFPGAMVANISMGTTPGTAATVQYLVGGTVATHYHSSATEIQYVIAGSGTERFGSKRVPFKPGSIFVIPPYMEHAGLAGPKSPPVALLVVKVPTQRNPDNHFEGPPPAGC